LSSTLDNMSAWNKASDSLDAQMNSRAKATSHNKSTMHKPLMTH